MRVAVCDSDERFVKDVTQQLKTSLLVEEVCCFADRERFFCTLTDEDGYDVVLMDLGAPFGLDAAEKLYEQDPQAQVIFVAEDLAAENMESLIQQMFLRRCNLSGFLIKPVAPEFVEASLNKAADGSQRKSGLVLRERGAVITVPFREIRYLESRGHVVVVHADYETVTYDRLQHLVEQLPFGFIQCHKSFAVNMKLVREIRGKGLLLESGETLPVSKARAAETRAAYAAFLRAETRSDGGLIPAEGGASEGKAGGQF